jgi:hypothetical protein
MIRAPRWLSALKSFVCVLWKRGSSGAKVGSQGQAGERSQPERRDEPGRPNNIYPLW